MEMFTSLMVSTSKRKRTKLTEKKKIAERPSPARCLLFG
jgi:hypothetical protein